MARQHRGALGASWRKVPEVLDELAAARMAI